MEDLDLPIIKGKGLQKKWLPMNDYLKFVEFNLKYTVNIKAVRRWKKELTVNVPFSIKATRGRLSKRKFWNG